MGQISMEIYASPGSLLSGNLQRVVLVGDPIVMRDAIRRPPQASRRSTFLASAIMDAINVRLEAKAA